MLVNEMSQPKRTYFRDFWLNNKEYMGWLKKCDKDPNKFYCTFCKVTKSLSNMGERAVKQHMNTNSFNSLINKFFFHAKFYFFISDDFRSTYFALNVLIIC